MNIYNYMNMKQESALKGEKTGMNFPYLNKINPNIRIVKHLNTIRINYK